LWRPCVLVSTPNVRRDAPVLYFRNGLKCWVFRILPSKRLSRRKRLVWMSIFWTAFDHIAYLERAIHSATPDLCLKGRCGFLPSFHFARASRVLPGFSVLIIFPGNRLHFLPVINAVNPVIWSRLKNAVDQFRGPTPRNT